MVNQHHALMLSEKKGETIIGLLVKDFFYFLLSYNYLVKVEVA